MTYEPVVRVTQYLVSCLPEEHPDMPWAAVTVERRGPNSWAVKVGAYVYNAAGESDYEPLPSSRTEEWLAEFRHDLDTALEAARKIAPTLTVGRHTVDQLMADYEPTAKIETKRSP